MQTIMPSSTEGARFRENVRYWMDREDVSISELARRCECSRPGLSRLLSGEEDCTIDRAARIARELGIPLSALFAEKFAQPA
jgi:transcriptional regulator with XRE-family HTH domain